MLISLGTSKASEARGHFGSAWGRLGKARGHFGSAWGRPGKAYFLDRQGLKAIVSAQHGAQMCIFRVPVEEKCSFLLAPRYPAGFIRAYPVLEARQSLRENRPMLIGLGAFRSLGSPRALRKRPGETWEGLFLDRQG